MLERGFAAPRITSAAAACTATFPGRGTGIPFAARSSKPECPFEQRALPQLGAFAPSLEALRFQSAPAVNRAGRRGGWSPSRRMSPIRRRKCNPMNARRQPRSRSGAKRTRSVRVRHQFDWRATSLLPAWCLSRSCFEPGCGLELLGPIRPLPSECIPLATEVAVGRGLLEDRPVQVEVAAEGTWAKVELRFDQA
jgi:hypothetical protein